MPDADMGNEAELSKIPSRWFLEPGAVLNEVWLVTLYIGAPVLKKSATDPWKWKIHLLAEAQPM